MRIMGLDYGDKTVGVAVSDALLLTAQPVETIKRERPGKLRQTLARIEELIAEYEVDTLVVGLPKRMDNQEGERCELSHAFGQKLEERTGLEVVYQDERLTTREADGVLAQGGVHEKNRKTYIDKLAASLILQGYLDRLQHDR